MPAGPVVIGIDGSLGSEAAIRDAGALLRPRSALVVVVWKAGLAFELLELPTATIGLPPAPVDVRTALETEQRLYEGAQRLAEQGASVAREAGFEEAEPLVVADDADTSVGETLADLARRQGAAALVVAPHGHGGVAHRLLGGTTRDVLRHATVPVLARSLDLPAETS